jgi:hypothetical protein
LNKIAIPYFNKNASFILVDMKELAQNMQEMRLKIRKENTGNGKQVKIGAGYRVLDRRQEIGQGLWNYEG